MTPLGRLRREQPTAWANVIRFALQWAGGSVKRAAAALDVKQHTFAWWCKREPALVRGIPHAGPGGRPRGSSKAKAPERQARWSAGFADSSTFAEAARRLGVCRSRAWNIAKKYGFELGGKA